jgi:Transposase IS4
MLQETQQNTAMTEVGKPLVRLTKAFWYHSIFLVLDSGFCVLEALAELRKVGIYGAAVIKKRHYWPKSNNGDAIAS